MQAKLRLCRAPVDTETDLVAYVTGQLGDQKRAKFRIDRAKADIVQNGLLGEVTVSDDGCTLSTVCRGSTLGSKYTVQADLSENAVALKCSCISATKEPICKHCAALLLWRLRMLSGSAGTASGAPTGALAPAPVIDASAAVAAAVAVAAPSPAAGKRRLPNFMRAQTETGSGPPMPKKAKPAVAAAAQPSAAKKPPGKPSDAMQPKRGKPTTATPVPACAGSGGPPALEMPSLLDMMMNPSLNMYADAVAKPAVPEASVPVAHPPTTLPAISVPHTAAVQPLSALYTAEPPSHAYSAVGILTHQPTEAASVSASMAYDSGEPAMLAPAFSLPMFTAAAAEDQPVAVPKKLTLRQKLALRASQASQSSQWLKCTTVCYICLAPGQQLLCSYGTALPC
ncbi:hypothetical protein WJX72_004277 [[Myrmecia] bisecta]|uniref:SWIM-type domain-containing protein n=1 Tax=[Myrmecia] bisecta TaxID=41462 RepID=A0AAW1QQ97_9CHLO